MVAQGSLPGIGSVDPGSRLAFLELLRRLVAVEALGGGGGGGVTAHSALTGLTVGDDHTQYLNATRGDARYTQRANNLSDLVSATTARGNLGLGGAAVLSVGTAAGTVAAGDDSRITGAAQKSANLSDLASAATARTNLGLLALATLAAVGTTEITNNAVTNAKLATVNTATFKGRTTAGVGNVEDLTGTQATALLDVFTTALKGLVPSGGSASTFLRGDGSWQTIAGGGDMLKSDNLLGLTNLATARANLGLGTLSVISHPGTTTTYFRGDGTFQTLPLPPVLANANTAVQNIGAAETYVTGSNVTIGTRVKAGTVIRWRLYVTKTAAGAAAPTISIKFGTAGTIADTTRVGPLTFVVQTGVVDRGWFDVECIVRSVSATGTVVGVVRFQHALTTTGFANQAQEQILGAVSGTFDTTPAALTAGLTLNPNTAASWGVEVCTVEAFNLT